LRQGERQGRGRLRCGGQLGRRQQHQLRLRSASPDLQLQRGAGWQRLGELRADQQIADLERRHAIGRPADDDCLEHLTRPEGNGLAARTRERRQDRRLKRGDHAPSDRIRVNAR